MIRLMMVLDKILDAFWSWSGLASGRVWDCLVGLSDKILGLGSGGRLCLIEFFGPGSDEIVRAGLWWSALLVMVFVLFWNDG